MLKIGTKLISRTALCTGDNIWLESGVLVEVVFDELWGNYIKFVTYPDKYEIYYPRENYCDLDKDFDFNIPLVRLINK